MKNTKTIKATLFSAIILSLVIPVTGFSLAEAKVSEDNIPNDRLLDRDAGWETKYASTEEFEKSQNAITTYVNNKHVDNAWNKQTKKNQIVIYNFDTLANSRQAGLNAVLADVENQKASGSYTPTLAEQKFHEWAAERVPNPVMPEVKQSYIDDVIEAYTSNANYGNVHSELFNSDAPFWMDVGSDKICELKPGCEQARENVANAEEFAVYGLIPFAYATTWSTYHELTTWVEANTCEQGGCRENDDDSGQGVLNTSQGGGENHSTSKYIYYYVLDESFVENYDVDHEVSGTVSLGWGEHDFGPTPGTDEVEIDTYHYFSSVTCGGSHCGTYSMSVQAEDATFET